MFAVAKKFAELAGRKKRPQKQLAQPSLWPPSQGGVNAVAAASAMPQTDALLLVNLIPAESGTKVRKGYVEHCVKVPLGDGIKTLVPFTQAKVDGAQDRLFALTSDGIYDVTSAGANPVKKLDFPIKGSETGWAAWTHFTTIAGQFILLTDKMNGYYLYTASTNLWTQGSVAGGITPTECVFVTVWKNRVWFIKRDSGTAWYLPVGQFSGNATAFEFGNKFKFGGYLKSLWNWTLDGGEGVDDYLVAISSAGDMVLYRGTDPSTAGSFNMAGVWYIGRPMQGRRQTSDTGGELLVLSNYGMLQMAKLISGAPATDESVSVSFKVNPRINGTMQRTATEYGWEMVQNPKDQLTLILTPKEVGQKDLQFVYNTATRAWTMFTGLPMKTAIMWRNMMYFGTSDNRICVYDGYLDNVLLNPAEGVPEPVEWESLTGFSALGSPAQFKRTHFLRPMFIGQASPVYKIAARYDFNLTPPAGSPIFPTAAGGIWGLGIWDISTWGGGYVVGQTVKGASGLGRYVAIYMRGRSASELTHVGTDVLHDVGGVL